MHYKKLLCVLWAALASIVGGFKHIGEKEMLCPSTGAVICKGQWIAFSNLCTLRGRSMHGMLPMHHSCAITPKERKKAVIVIDRIEGSRAILEADGEMIEIAATILPLGSVEGDVLELTLCDDAKAKIQSENDARLNRLKAQDPGDMEIDI